MAQTEIIIPVYNGERHIGALLESLSCQTTDDFLVTIADNGSSDGSVAIAKKFHAHFDLKTIDASYRQGKAGALNKAVEESSAQHLVFIDQDDTVNATYVEAMSDALGQTPFVASMMDGVSLNRAFDIQPREIPFDQRLGQYAIKTAAGGTIGITRGAFDDIGGFDEGFNYSTNDVEFCWRAHAKGYDLQLVTDAILSYRLRETVSGNFRQGIEYGVGNFHIARLHPEIRGDQANMRQLLVGAAALTAHFVVDAPARARTAHLLGKNIGQARERLLDFLR